MKHVVLRGWLLVLIALVWELRARSNPSFFVPPISDIADEFWSTWFGGPARHLFVSEEFRSHVVPSLSRMARGWLIAIGFGVGVGLPLGMSRRAQWVLNPAIRFGMATPSVLLLPLAISVFGIGDSMNVFVIALGATWPVLVNTIDGVESVDRVAMLAARSMRLRRSQRLLRVLLPGASPQIFTGLRVSLGVALILMVSSELFAAPDGIGHFILMSQQSFRFTDMWTGIALVGLLGIVLNTAFSLIEGLALRWHAGARRPR